MATKYIIHSPDYWHRVLKLDTLENKHRLPEGVLKAMLAQESGGDPNAYNRLSRAEGLFQFVPTTAVEEHVKVKDPLSSAKGAAKYLAQHYQTHGGDLDKGLAAYNWGPGNLRKAIRLHGDDWLNYAPPETQNYVFDIKARCQLDALRKEIPKNDPDAAHACLTSNPELVERMQRKLKKFGFEVGEAGVFDDKTAAAWTQFKQAQKYKPRLGIQEDAQHGQVEIDTLNRLLISRYQGASAKKLTALRQAEERQYLKSLSQSVSHESDAQSVHAVLAANTELVRDIQKKLGKLGYEVGEATGEFNLCTAEALKQFEAAMQKHHVKGSKQDGFEVDGQLDMGSVSQLISTNNARTNQRKLREH